MFSLKVSIFGAQVSFMQYKPVDRDSGIPGSFLNIPTNLKMLKDVVEPLTPLNLKIKPVYVY